MPDQVTIKRPYKINATPELPKTVNVRANGRLLYKDAADATETTTLDDAEYLSVGESKTFTSLTWLGSTAETGSEVFIFDDEGLDKQPDRDKDGKGTPSADLVQETALR